MFSLFLLVADFNIVELLILTVHMKETPFSF